MRRIRETDTEQEQEDRERYNLRIERLSLLSFTSGEIDVIETQLKAVSVVDGNHFEAIWYHVKQGQGATLNLPSSMIPNLLKAVAYVLDTRKFSRLATLTGEPGGELTEEQMEQERYERD